MGAMTFPGLSAGDPSEGVLRRSLAPDMSVATLYAVLRLRVGVFVVEQACPYPELDGRDLERTTRHLWVEQSEPLACLRLLEERHDLFRLGRMCTARPARGRGYGRRLMEAALAEIGDAECVLDAQSYLAGFYEGFGFRVDGEEFDESGIRHLPMRRELRNSG